MSALFTSCHPYNPIPGFMPVSWNVFHSKQGIDGLCRINGRRLDLLSVNSSSPGTGQFRRFIKTAKQKFDAIYIWEIWNEDLPEILRRYGFAECDPMESDGGTAEGMKWEAP